MRRHDWRLVPVAVLAWGVSFVATSGWNPSRWVLLILLAGLVLVAGLCFRAGRAWVGVLLVLVLVTGVTSGIRVWQRHHSPVSDLAKEGVAGQATVVLTSEPQRKARVVVAAAELVSIEARGRIVQARAPVVLLASGPLGEQLLALEPGALHRVGVRAAEPRPDEAVAAVLSVRQIGPRLAPPSELQGIANRLRAGLRAAMSHSPPDQAALVPSLVVGDTSGVDDRMSEEFRSTGLTHLMAVSGANLTLMLGVLLAAVRAVGVRGWWVRVAAVAGVGGFVLICGQEPSVLRAAAMGVVALAATGAGPGNRSVRSLCLAVTALVWIDPWLSRAVGFALSVVACAGIVLLAPYFRDAMVRWCPRWIAEAVAVALAAQLATQPIVTAISDQVSIVGVATNVLAAPFIGPTTVLGLLAALVSGVGWLAVAPAWLAGWCAQPVLWVAHAGAALPSATRQWQPDAAGIALLTVVAAVISFTLTRVLRYRLGATLALVVMLAIGLARPVPFGWPGRWDIAFCDVGQGDGTAVRAGEGAAILIDVGPEARPTLACLSELGVRDVPMIVLTHYHADHIGGMRDVMTRFRARLVLVRDGEIPGWLDDLVAANGGEVRAASEGESVTVGGATWQTVSVPRSPGAPDAEADGSVENDASVVGVASSGGVRVLLAGDAEPGGQREALRAARADGVSLAAEVLKLPHHGSARQERRFFEASGASLAVASAGLKNDYGHPAKAALDLATGLGMQVARTDLQGTILVARNGDTVSFHTLKSPGG